MKKIFLTGASSGIGLATARALVGAGHEVWGTSRDPSRLPKVAGLRAVALDLADLDSVQQNFANALNEAGHFDVVINNAGSGHFGPARSISTEVLQMQLQNLVIAQIELCQLAMRAMQEQNSGLIINVTSLASRLPVPFMSAYNAAKAAMASFTMTWQLELGSRNLRIVDLQPADICTSFNDAVLKTEIIDPDMRAAAARTWEAVDRNLKSAPKPELVARAILKLIEQKHPPARVTVGGVFQAKITPVIFRFLPQSIRIWGIRKYFGI